VERDEFLKLEKEPSFLELRQLVVRLCSGMGTTMADKMENARQLTTACQRVKEAGLWDSLPLSYMAEIKRLLLGNA
jgi:hypothetical protein